MAAHESLDSDIIRFLGIYRPQSEGPAEIAVRVFDPESVNLRVSPNPFNASTMLRFELPESRWVRVEIFDLQGHSSARIIDGLCQSGSYEIPFDGSYLPSGIYVYRLTAGSFQATGKMVLVK